MADNPVRIREFLEQNLGHYLACIRQALMMAVMAWVLAARKMAPVVPEASAELVGRRRFLGVLLKAAGAGVAASVPVLLWLSAARAFCGQRSKNADCGVGWKCANTAGPNQPICMECVQ